MKHLTGILASLAVAAAVLAGCGGAEVDISKDPEALLAAGRYAEARAAAVARGGREPVDRAVIALSLIVEKGDQAAAEEGAAALATGAKGVERLVAGETAIRLTDKLPPSFDQDLPFSLLLLETVLGGAGLGPLAQQAADAPQPGAATRSLAVESLERLSFAITIQQGEADTGRLLKIWNGCYTLLGGSLAAEDDATAWILYRSVGDLAVALYDAAPDAELTDVMLTMTVTVIEQNPTIALPVRCDLGSPFDRLAVAMTYKRELRVRLERSVAAAAGCTRGAFAPTTD